MFAPRWRKVLGDLGANLTRTALAVLSIAVGVFAIGMVAGANELMQRDVAASYGRVNPGAIQVRIWPGFDDELLATVRRTPGVAAAEAVGLTTVRAEVAPGEWRSLILFAVDDLTAMEVNKVRPDSGRWPVGDREILLERSGRGEFGAATGAPMTIELQDGTRKAMPLAGSVYDASQVPTFFTNELLGYITLDTLEWLGETRRYDRVYLTVAEGGLSTPHLRAVAAEVEDRVKRSGHSVFTIIPTPGESPMKAGLDAMTAVLSVLAALLIALSMFLIVNTVGALLLQQRRQIGVMKAVGATTGQLAGMYLAYVLLLGLLALLIAAPAGAWAAYAVTGMMAGLLNFDPGPFALAPWVLALQGAVALLVPLLAAVWPVAAGARLTVREALASHGLGRGRFGRGLLDRALERVRFLSRPLLLALRNTFRRKGRLLLTLFTLTLGGAIFIAVVSTQAAIERQIGELMNFFGEDVRINFAQSYRKDKIASIAMSVPGVQRVEFWTFGSAHRVRDDESTGDQLQIIAPPWGTELMRPAVLRGRWLLEQDGNAIVVDTKFTRAEPDADVGARVTLELDGDEHEFVIVGVMKQQGNGSSIAYMNRARLDQIYQNAGYAGSVRVVTARHDPTFQLRVADALEARFKERGLRVFYNETQGSFRQLLEQQFRLIVVFLGVMAGLIAAVGAIGLMGTMSMNVVERTREIGVLRAVGASNAAIQRIVVSEGVLIGLISWAAAALLAVPIGRLLSDGVGLGFLNSPLPPAYSPLGVVVWLAAVVVLAAAASALPAWRASRLTVRDVLAYE